MKINLLLTPAFIVLLIGTNVYSLDHFSDRGCDGGLCGLYLISYTIPLTLAWLVAWVGAHKVLCNKLSGIGWCIAAFLLCTFGLSVADSAGIDELKHTPYLIMVITFSLIVMPLARNLVREFNDWKKL